jgi:type I restriction enzyme S subunit
MATSQDFVNWVCGPELDPQFLALLLRASRRFILSLASGAIHKTVYVPAAQSFWVCIPSITAQGGIVESTRDQLCVVDRAREAAEAQFEALNKLPTAILRQAFSGAL